MELSTRCEMDGLRLSLITMAVEIFLTISIIWIVLWSGSSKQEWRSMFLRCQMTKCHL